MSSAKNTLTTAEWAVMSALWGKKPQVLSEVIASMGNRMDWSYTTYSAYLRRLCDKGFVGFEARGRDKFYYALVEMDECIQAESNHLFNKLRENGAKKLLVCMIRDSKLTKEDQEELKKLIDELSEGGDEE
jgi:BlaI family penicillinase repressor